MRNKIGLIVLFIMVSFSCGSCVQGSSGIYANPDGGYPVVEIEN